MRSTHAAYWVCIGIIEGCMGNECDVDIERVSTGPYVLSPIPAQQ